MILAVRRLLVGCGRTGFPVSRHGKWGQILPLIDVIHRYQGKLALRVSAQKSSWCLRYLTH